MHSGIYSSSTSLFFPGCADCCFRCCIRIYCRFKKKRTIRVSRYQEQHPLQVLYISGRDATHVPLPVLVYVNVHPLPVSNMATTSLDSVLRHQLFTTYINDLVEGGEQKFTKFDNGRKIDRRTIHGFWWMSRWKHDRWRQTWESGRSCMLIRRTWRQANNEMEENCR